MWLISSTKPISTTRSPFRGSRPVVSVSKTISRMTLIRKIAAIPPPAQPGRATMGRQSKPQLHEDEVEPAAELEPDLGHPCGLDEAVLGVEANRDVVLAGDAGDHDM